MMKMEKLLNNTLEKVKMVQLIHTVIIHILISMKN
ncbi:hypothetical protein TVAGG3_0754040 [Trichomonas vaginalis G3]|nr:hypothetical protein TVAGG3_0754040 [Trichomonas vaginalis G3]KAI5512743.1 hypothetical protein TVAGG3_0754040 [Trichomonas vaginalis G3]